MSGRGFAGLRSVAFPYLLDELLLRWLRAYNRLRDHEEELDYIEATIEEWRAVSGLVYGALQELRLRAVAPDTAPTPAREETLPW